MKNFKPLFAASVVIAACFFTASKPALADSYQFFLLWSDNTFFYGMDDSVNVALYEPFGGPACNYSKCYLTFLNGVPTSLFTPTTPSLVDDQGTQCTPAVPPGGVVFHGVCNNGRDAFTGFLDPVLGLTYASVYVGSYPNITALLQPHTGYGPIFMNSYGDIVFDEESSGFWYLALDTTTHVPEPGSILLLGTGALGILGTIRRRMCQGCG